MKAFLAEPDSTDWVDALTMSEHDFYHFPKYAKLSALQGERPRAFIARSGEHSLLIPIHERELPKQIFTAEHGSDVTSPYGYPGPIWSRNAPTDFVAESLAAFVEVLLHENIVSAFVRLHPLLNTPETFAACGETVFHGPTVYIDLTLSEDELWRQTRRGHRREILALEANGYVAVIDENWSGLDDFMLCYNQTMDRREALSSYYFPRSYFIDLRDCLGDKVSLCVVRKDGDIACAGIVTEVAGLAQYHLSATAHAHLSRHPSKLMLNFLRSWLRTRANRVYHIGGGVGSQLDSLYAFKSGFSPLTAQFHTWRVIPDAARYEERVAQWSKAANAAAGHDPLFFPAYRAAL